MELSTLIETLSKVSPATLATLLKPYALSLPRSKRMGLLKTIVVPLLTEERSTLLKRFNQEANLMTYEDLYRLSHVRLLEKYAEFQFELQLYQLKNKALNKQYVQSFFTLIVETILAKKPELTLAGFFASLGQLSTQEIDMDPVALNRAFDDVFFDEPKSLDGLTFSQFRSVLYFGSTIQELKKLGEKYHVTIPSYISKTEVQKRLKEALIAINQWNEDKAAQIQNASLKTLQTLGETWQINPKTYMTKEEMIEYLLQSADPSKPYYEKPVDESVYYEQTIQNFLDTYNGVLQLTPSTVKLNHQPTVQSAIQAYQDAILPVQKRLQKEKEHLDLLWQSLMVMLKTSTPTPQVVPSVITIPAPKPKETILVKETVQSSPSVDVKPYLDRIDQSLATQQQLIQIIQEMIRQNRMTQSTHTTNQLNSSTNVEVAPTKANTPKPWYEGIQVFDLILGTILLIQILILIFRL